MRVVILAALVVSGCGDPYSGRRQATAPLPGEQPARTPPSHHERVPHRVLAATPEQAARRAAELTTNWTGETAAGNYAELARITVGSARESARESAARLQSDPHLSAPRAGSRGTVEVTAVRSAAARTRELVVVTRETLTADGLQQTRWRVTVAAAERRPGGWVISRWEPQP